MSENESYELRPSVPIIRVFRARARQGCERALADKLATSSVEVVQGQPGFLGYLVAGPASEHQHEFIFRLDLGERGRSKGAFWRGMARLTVAMSHSCQNRSRASRQKRPAQSPAFRASSNSVNGGQW